MEGWQRTLFLCIVPWSNQPDVDISRRNRVAFGLVAKGARSINALP